MKLQMCDLRKEDWTVDNDVESVVMTVSNLLRSLGHKKALIQNEAWQGQGHSRTSPKPASKYSRYGKYPQNQLLVTVLSYEIVVLPTAAAHDHTSFLFRLSSILYTTTIQVSFNRSFKLQPKSCVKKGAEMQIAETIKRPCLEGVPRDRQRHKIEHFRVSMIGL